MVPKYKNQKVFCDGHTFDSKKEANRYLALKSLRDAGEISDLGLQVPYELIPAQYEKTTERYTRGPKKGMFKPGKLIERPVYYVADFVYWDRRTDSVVVEDVKGFRTPDYIIKRKLMLHEYGLRVKEV